MTIKFDKNPSSETLGYIVQKSYIEGIFYYGKGIE